MAAFIPGLKRGMIVAALIKSDNLSDLFTTNGLGLEIYSGWAICNGLNGTPDLRGSTIVGQDVTNPQWKGMGSQKSSLQSASPDATNPVATVLTYLMWVAPSDR